MIHLKGIRIYVESVLRYSLPPKFLSFCIRPNKGQEKRLMDGLIRKFMRPGDNPSMYGLREDNEDGEDFLPFVLIRVTQY